ncbi:helix-turn-helix transcriptional regulator [bacterium]|nr:helix-turn-helix transcriptional regulator [bacterium]
MDNTNFLNTIRTCLKVRGITQARLVKDLGLAQNTFTNWMNRNALPSTEILYKISKYFGVTMEYLITGNEESIPDDIAVLCVKLQELSESDRKFIAGIIELYLSQKK